MKLSPCMKFPIFLSCFLAPSLQAGLLYYLPFATGYDPAALVEDGLVGQGVGGHGVFAANGSANADLMPTSMVYVDVKGNALATTGGSALIDADEEGVTLSNVAPLNLTGPNAPSGQTLWISFIGRQTAPLVIPPGGVLRFFNLGLRAPDNTIFPADSGGIVDEIIAFGMSTQLQPHSQFWQMWDRGTNSFGWTSTEIEIPTTQTTFLLARIDLNYVGANERFTMWINPPLGTELDENNGIAFMSSQSDFNVWSDLREIRLAAGFSLGGNSLSSAWQVDEIRMGDTWQDVTPYLPLKIVTCTRTLTETLEVTWNAAPNCTDTVEWSSDLMEWHPYATSTRVNPPNSVLATWETPVQTEPLVYFRVSRLR